MYQSKIRNNKQRGKQSKNRPFVEPGEDQEYGVVQDMLGNGRLRALCNDGVIRIGRIRGSMRKYAGKVIIERGDLIIVARRDFEDDKVDVIHKYNHEETSRLVRQNELSKHLVKAINQTDTDVGTSHDYVVFMNEEDALDETSGEFVVNDI
jgi:translation initiation factor 1A